MWTAGASSRAYFIQMNQIELARSISLYMKAHQFTEKEERVAELA